MNRKYWVGLSLVPGIGPVRIQRLLEIYGSPERVWNLSEDELRSIPFFNDRLVAAWKKTQAEVDLERFLLSCKEAEIHLLCPEDSEFPANLRHIFDPPPVIYYRGSIKVADQHSIAIVGSRKMTAYGKRVTTKLVREMVQKGLTVVSGMALGVDGVAHEIAIAEGGRTIAVLGSGVDVIYPREHAKLYQQIQQSGAVISTYPPGTPPEKGNFPARNRIISGLTLGTIVVEAGERSGALITADQALEQNREVFAVPGSIFSPMSAGTNALIQKGAKLITSADDILDELAGDQMIPLFTQSTAELIPLIGEKAQLNDAERQIITFLEPGEQTFDDLLERTKLSTAGLNALLLDLELKGIITQIPGLKFTLN